MTAPNTTTTRTTSTTRRPKSTGRQPSDQAIDAAIDAATRLLRLPTFRDRYGEIADAAGREQLSYRAFLSELLLAECDDRQERRAARRVHEAGFPRPKTLADFDFAANTAINPATINTLAGCGWVSKGQSLCLIGDSGTGKSHLLIGLGTAAAQAGHKVRYVLAAKLVNELVESRRRTPAVPDHRTLRPGRAPLPRRARLHGTRQARRRAAVPGPD
jgi:DNA replication protein DnaC